MKKIIILFSFFLIVFLTGCNSLRYECSDVDFSLKTDSEGAILGDIPDDVRVITDEEEFSDYLNSEFFDEVFSTAFQTENAKYDESFFAEHDLIAIIYHATTGLIEEMTVGSVQTGKDGIVVTLHPSFLDDTATPDMGRYFTFYIVIDKTDSSSASVSVQTDILY